MYAAYVRYLLYGIQRHDHLYGGAVGVGDYVARGVERIAGIDLGDDQRHVRIHTEGARVVDHEGAVFGYGLGELLRGAGACRREGYVHALEGVVMLQELYLDFAAAEGVCTSRTALRSEEQQLVYGEIGSFVEDGEELLSHGAAGAYDCNFHIC